MRAARHRRVAALVLALALCFLAAATVAAADPSPTGAAPAAGTPSTAAPAGASPSPAVSPGASPASSAAPCPNPTPGPTPSQAAGATPAPTPHPNLCPAEPRGADPFSLISWLFTPVFQVLFLGLAFLYNASGDIGIAIVLLTIVIRIVLVPVFRAQIVSQRRIQLLQPELRVLQQKYKGDRARISQEQMRLYQERGVNPLAGCLPGLLQLILLIPMYSVFSQGLTAPDISSMLRVFGQPVFDVACQAGAVTGSTIPCINPAVHWLPAWQPDPATGPLLNASRPEILFTIPGVGFGLSLLALISALLQLIQTRMMTPATSDPQVAAQQRIFLILPLFSIVYGSFLPAGLFIYWIVTTVFSIVQQYLIAGWGGLFPLFGWTPSFAANHTPRYPVPVPVPVAAGGAASGGTAAAGPATRRDPADSAAGTVRPARNRRRGNRRGRRR